MRLTLKLEAGLLLFFAAALVCVRGYGQETGSIYERPGTGFQVPRTAGTLTTALSVSENILLGYNGGKQTAYFTNLSGNAAFLSHSGEHPFSMVYAGGYQFSTATIPSHFFHDLSLSQVIDLKRWNFVLADSVSYLPQAPVGGLSGVGGIGDLGINPIQLGLAGNGLLSRYGTRVTNIASGSAIYMLTGRTSIAGNASHELIRFPDTSAGVENTKVTGGGTFTHHVDARTSFTGTYDYAHLFYPQYDLTFHSQSALFGVARQWTQRLKTTFGAGPQFTTSLAGKSSIDYSVDGRLNYDLQRYQTSAYFVRAVNTGSGVTTASVANNGTLFLTRPLGNFASIALSASYNHSTTLPSKFGLQYTTSNIIGNAQYSHALTRKLSGFVSYTAQRQRVDQGALAVNPLTGLTQNIGFGLTYSPRPFNIGSP